MCFLYEKQKTNEQSSTVTSATAASTSKAPLTNIKEFTVRIPKNSKKTHHVMKFNATHKIDFAQWKNVKMEREQSGVRDVRPVEDEMPKFGAGSEYNREFKEELRRKKFGFQPKKVKQGEKPNQLNTEKILSHK